MTTYRQIWADYLSKQKGYPACRTLYLGHATRYLREEIRKSRTALAEESGVGLSLLKSMETKREAYSTWKNTLHLAQALNVPVETLIQRSQEEFPGNFFIQKKDSRPRLDYDGISVFPMSPPIHSQSDFLLLKVQIAPQQHWEPCADLQTREIACYVTEGPLSFKMGRQTHEIRANQSFFFDGSVEHHFLNENTGKRIEFFLCLNPPPEMAAPHSARSSAAPPMASVAGLPRKGVIKRRPKADEAIHDSNRQLMNALDIAAALEYVREKASPAPGIPLPWNMLSRMTGIPVRALMHLQSGKSEIVYWDKLEALAQGTGIPLDEIMAIAMGNCSGRFELCNALHRGYLDYGDQFGLRIYSAVRPGTARRKFFIGQVFLNKRSSLPSMRRRWKYRTPAMICAVVQDGRILVEYGERKKEKLETDDSVYLNANLEFVVHNLEHQESKLFLFSQPPLF